MLSEFERKIIEDCQSVLLNAIFSHMTIQVKKKKVLLSILFTLQFLCLN